MEKFLSLKTKDKHIIYGTLATKKKTKKLIIFVHGLTGNQNEHIFYNGAQYFTSKWYDTFRFDLYSWEEKWRKLSECGIDTHATDLNTVLTHFDKKYSHIYLIGHSLWAPTIMLANLKSSHIKKIIFWDPSNKLLHKDHLPYDKRIDKYISEWGTECLLDKKLLEQRTNLSDIPSKIIKPTKFIFAEKDRFIKDWESDLKKITIEYKVSIIPNATHCFDEEWTEKKLFQETYKFIK